jgi:hypothetical protein
VEKLPCRGASCELNSLVKISNQVNNHWQFCVHTCMCVGTCSAAKVLITSSWATHYNIILVTFSWVWLKHRPVMYFNILPKWQCNRCHYTSSLEGRCFRYFFSNLALHNSSIKKLWHTVTEKGRKPWHLMVFLLINCTEQRPPWETNSCSASQEIPFLFRRSLSLATWIQPRLWNSLFKQLRSEIILYAGRLAS